MLDQETGPGGRRVRGAHRIIVPRLHGVRKRMFDMVAKRLQKRPHGWRITASRVEEVWKQWEGRLKRLK